MTSVIIKVGWVTTIFLAAMVGCDRTTSRPESGSEARLAARADGGSTIRPRSAPDEPLLVVIQPEVATAARDLSAAANDTSVSYAWSVNGRPLEGESGRVLPKALFRRSDTVSVEVALNEQRAHAETMIQNSPPRVVELSLGRPLDTLHQGLDLTATPTGVDADGDEIRWEYQWSRNGEILTTETTAVLPGDRYQRGDRIGVQVTPYDGEDRGEPYTPNAVVISNGAPEFVSQPPTHAGGAEYQYQVQAADPEADPITYRLVKAPAGMTLDPSGMVRWSLRGVTAGLHQVEVEVDDGRGGKASQPFELNIAYSEGS